MHEPVAPKEDTQKHYLPSRHATAPAKARVTWARIDPEGNVSATWRTWALLGGAVIWATLFYAKIEQIPARVDALSIEVQAHREVLIKAGMLPVSALVKP